VIAALPRGGIESIKERRLFGASLSAFVDKVDLMALNCQSETDGPPVDEAWDGSPGAAGDETIRRVR
jgi:hypothetical protein